MEIARGQLMELARMLNILQEDFGVDPSGDAGYRSNGATKEGSLKSEEKLRAPGLNFGLSALVYEWARGVQFKDVMQLSEVHEGSIVRCITRLDELLRDVRNAARVMGNPSLYRKMEAASECIKRDIVFSASLYVA
jgi:superfamily II RNA helicase